MSAAIRRLIAGTAATCIAALLCLSPPALAQGAPSYQIVSRTPDAVELRFHNTPLKDVHADDAQNALAINFQAPVDGAMFDRLPADMPDWIAMAYASYDTGVIRATRPATFLTRQEGDGFSLRIVARGAAPPPPAGPVALRGPVDGTPYPAAYPPPRPATGGGSRYQAYTAMRNYAQLELAVRRGDPVWSKVYDDAATESDSHVSIGSEYHAYHNGDRIIASNAEGRIPLGGGLSLIGSLDDTDSSTHEVRAADGTLATNVRTNLITGAGGFAFDGWNDTDFTLEALEGNAITGVRLTGFNGDPDSYWTTALTYHEPYLEAPDALAARGLKDEAVLATGRHIGYGVWAALDGKFDNYGVHGNASIAKTAGWDANLRAEMDFDGLLTGLSYDGHGEYLLDYVTFTGAAPSPYIPLSIRNMETHAITGSVSSMLWGDVLWLDFYGGYAVDRYAGNGALYGAALRYRPQPGVDLALGVRHSLVSMTQGEIGPETSAGLTFTFGFNGAPLTSYF